MAYEVSDSLKGFFAKKNGKVVEKYITWRGQQVYNTKRPDDTGPGLMFTGEIKNYKPHGYGEYNINHGSGFTDNYYKGNWNDGIKEGEGEYFSSSGNGIIGIFYKGDFKNNTLGGYGRLETTYLPSSAIVMRLTRISYEGNWAEGKRNGYGIQTWDHSENLDKNNSVIETKSVYDGAWLDDKFHGYGKLISIFGWVYDGEFDNGKKHGFGKLTNINGEIVEGIWVSDSFKKD